MKRNRLFRNDILESISKLISRGHIARFLEHSKTMDFLDKAKSITKLTLLPSGNNLLKINKSKLNKKFYYSFTNNFCLIFKPYSGPYQTFMMEFFYEKWLTTIRC